LAGGRKKVQNRGRAIISELAYTVGKSSTASLLLLLPLLSCLTMSHVLLLRCKNSLVLHGAPECYFVFDQVSQKTGLNAIKNVGPYPGLELVTCVLQLDCGPPKTSPICFDNSGHDKYHPYVVARVEGGIPEYNLQQPKFGWIIKDNNNNGTQYTFSFQGPGGTTPAGCNFI
jgi:hypothetical protein